MCRCWGLRPRLVGLSWAAAILPHFWVPLLPSHSGFPSSFLVVTGLKLSMGDEGQRDGKLCGCQMQGTKLLGFWRFNILKTESFTIPLLPTCSHKTH